MIVEIENFDTADTLKKEDRPPYIEPKIKAAPKLRQIYWCDFHKDARLPEMWKKRPVVILSFKNTLHGICTVIPTSTDAQGGPSAEWAHQLSFFIEEGKTSWVICNHLYTVHTSRLSQFNGKIPIVSPEEFAKILLIINRWLPTH